MLAVKAKYENGTVHWEQKPPVAGSHDLIVVFADVPDAGHAEPDDPSATVREAHDENRIWGDFSLANLEAAYGDDEPEYSDVMLKTPNPEFAP